MALCYIEPRYCERLGSEKCPAIGNVSKYDLVVVLCVFIVVVVEFCRSGSLSLLVFTCLTCDLTISLVKIKSWSCGSNSNVELSYAENKTKHTILNIAIACI